jgi:hypothetical protein
MAPLTPAVALQPEVKIENEEQFLSDASEDEASAEVDTGTITEGVKQIELNGETGSIADAVAKIEISDDELYEPAVPEPFIPEAELKTEVVENNETGETVAKEPEVVIKQEPDANVKQEPVEPDEVIGDGADGGAEGPQASGDDQG